MREFKARVLVSPWPEASWRRKGVFELTLLVTGHHKGVFELTLQVTGHHKGVFQLTLQETGHHKGNQGRHLGQKPPPRCLQAPKVCSTSLLTQQTHRPRDVPPTPIAVIFKMAH